MAKSINCSEILKKVLDDLYERIEGDEGTKDRKIKEAIQTLHDLYAKLAVQRAKVDYSEDVVRFAYVFMNVMAHSNYIHQILGDVKELKSLFQQPMTKVCAVGGGPGSDVLGILKFRDSIKSDTHLVFQLIDREQLWMDSLKNVQKHLHDPLPFETYALTIDVSIPDSYVSFTEHHDSDLFTFSFFISEVFRNRGVAQPFFELLFENANHDALFLFIDNNASSFYGWFDTMAKRAGLELLYTQATSVVVKDSNEDKFNLGVYFAKFNFPKLRSNVAIRLYQKS